MEFDDALAIIRWLGSSSRVLRPTRWEHGWQQLFATHRLDMTAAELHW